MSQCNAKYVTIAHQDDIYEPAYAEKDHVSVGAGRGPLTLFRDMASCEMGGNYGRHHQHQKTMLLPMRSKDFPEVSLSGGVVCHWAILFVVPQSPMQWIICRCRYFK